MTKYQIATNDHAMKIRPKAIGTSNNHFKRSLSDYVIFQIRAADPENDVGAETTIFLMLIFRSYVPQFNKYLNHRKCIKFAVFNKIF